MAATPTISSVLDRMMDVWQRHDMEGFGALFTDDADFVNIFGDWLKGRRQITEDHAGRQVMERGQGSWSIVASHNTETRGL